MSSQQSSQPIVSVVIATRDRPDALAQCLEHLSRQDYDRREIVLVDNSLGHEAAQGIGRYPVSKYLRQSPNSDNVSLLKNVGLDASQGEIVAFLDDDSLVQEGWMRTMVQAFRDPTVGGVTGRVIESAFAVSDSPIIATLSPRNDMVCNFNNLWSEPAEVDYLYGCNMSWRRTALVAAGALDPWMSYSRGEQEWSIRVKRAGYKLMFSPGVVVQHLRAPRAAGTVQRSGTRNFRSRMIHCRSLTYQYARHFGLSRDLAKLTLWRLPKGDVWQFFQEPRASQLLMPIATLSGVINGYVMAGVATLGLHRPPPVAPVRGVVPQNEDSHVVVHQ